MKQSCINIIRRVVISLIFIGSIVSSNAQTSEKKTETEISDSKIVVYYFHNTKRCATCNAIENESVKALEALYPEKVKAKEISFQSINLDEEKNNELAEKFDVSSKLLLITKGRKKTDITNDAFTFVRTNPEKLKKRIKSVIDKLL